MIFLDESGKRWKRIKHSAAGVAVLGILPVLVLTGGSLVYHPQWGVLPLTKQATGVVLSEPTKPLPSDNELTTPKQTATSTAITTTQSITVPTQPKKTSTKATNLPTSHK